MGRPRAGIGIGAAALALIWPGSSGAQQVDIGSGSVVETVRKLHPGQFAWIPQLAPSGPLLLIVNLKTQRAIVYRNGVPIGASTISTGRPGYATPTGVFTILQKHLEHYSSKYDNAPMPYMQRLTWKGIALHAGQLPGYPASHGCIRLPLGFARLLYGETRVGMTVVVADRTAIPRVAPTPQIALAGAPSVEAAPTSFVWQPDRSPSGPISVIVSVADGKALVLRNGVEIGSAPVSVRGPTAGSWAYTLRNIDSEGQHWLRLPLSGETGPNQPVPREEWDRFQAPEQFRRAVASIMQPGSTVIVTTDSLRSGGAVEPVIESEPPEGER